VSTLCQHRSNTYFGVSTLSVLTPISACQHFPLNVKKCINVNTAPLRRSSPTPKPDAGSFNHLFLRLQRTTGDRTLTGRWDAGTLLYNTNEQHPTSPTRPASLVRETGVCSALGIIPHEPVPTELAMFTASDLFLCSMGESLDEFHRRWRRCRWQLLQAMRQRFARW
jgi:hypothetical protein